VKRFGCKKDFQLTLTTAIELKNSFPGFISFGILG
jgi:hypothetical protein